MPEKGEKSRLPFIGMLIGLWAILPPYVVAFGKLEVRSTVEFVDHALPGAAVLAVALTGLVQLRRARPSQMLLFAGGGVITLAGFWMLSTHIGLLSSAREGNVPGGAVAWHGLPGIAVMLLGIAWTARFWDTDEAPDH